MPQTRIPPSLPFVTMALLLSALVGASPAQAGEPLGVATFNIDVTPPLGSPLCGGSVQPAREIVDRLSARGVILYAAGGPIVLCAVDWIGIGNGGHDEWTSAIADAVGISTDRVTVHTLHQHDTPFYDSAVEALLEKHGLGGTTCDLEFSRKMVERIHAAVEAAHTGPRRTATHYGVGVAEVKKVASNRRILGPDGKVAIVRFSSSKNPEAIAAPEGVIDSTVQVLSLWDGDEPVVSLSHYATHPQSYYGQGGVSADFVGMARAQREKAVPGAMHVHFSGAGGNVAAGKYNDGSPENRPVLAERLAAGMEEAWNSTVRQPIDASSVGWFTKHIELPPRETLVADELQNKLTDESLPPSQRIRAARDLVFLRHNREQGILLRRLQVGMASVVYFPGELFVEYQLLTRKLGEPNFVAVAAYGDYGPGYIGTEIAYSQGGYETGPPSRTSPTIEAYLTAAIERLMNAD